MNPRPAAFLFLVGAAASSLGGCAGPEPSFSVTSLPAPSGPAAVTRGAAVGRFADVTGDLGISPGSGAAAWADIDGDGWVDLCVDGVVYRNLRGRAFVELSKLPEGSSGVFADFDNDGFLDVYCWGTGKLFRNLDGAGFADVTDRLPARPMAVCRGAVWADFDRDGFVDLYVGGYEIWPDKEYPDVVYRNDAGHRFVEVWRSPGRPRRARGVTAADFDEDGWIDVYVSNYRLQPNSLWRNLAGQGFQDVGGATGTAGDESQGWFGHTIGSAWGDFDADGHLDLFVGNFSHPPAFQDRPKLLRNPGGPGPRVFGDRSPTAGIRWQESYASPALGDFDNDGRLDVFFTTVYPKDHSVLYRNAGDWRFRDVTEATGVRSARTYQAAWGDFDNDGDLDLATGGRIYRNPGSRHHRLVVHLVGGGPVNAAAIGAEVRIRAGDLRAVRQVSGGTGEGNQNGLACHFGLGGFAGPVLLEVRWPDGRVETCTVPADRRIVLWRVPPR